MSDLVSEHYRLIEQQSAKELAILNKFIFKPKYWSYPWSNQF